MITLMDDTLAGLVRGPRAQGAFLLKSYLRPPWSLRIQDEAPLTVMTLVSGEAWIVRAGEPAVRIRPGDVAVVPGPEPYTVADSPETAPQIIILPGQGCETVGTAQPMDELTPGSRSWGTPAGATAVLLSGTYLTAGEIGLRMSAALPHVLVRRAGEDEPLINLLAAEIARERPGQELVLDRVLDLLVVAVIRSWLDSEDDSVPAWLRAQGDPVVGSALRLMHQETAAPWTVALLARRAGVSRATFARRFASLVGEPPMNYLTARRLDNAAELLLSPGATISAVARQVGYSTPFALSAAFKRERGVTPAAHRATAGL